MDDQTRRAPRARWWTFLGSIIAGAGILIVYWHTSERLTSVSVSINKGKVAPSEGKAFVWSIPVDVRREKVPRSIQMFEDSTPLAFTSSSHQVKTSSGGVFAASTKQVWFSSTDGSNPITNGRQYVLKWRREVPAVYLALTWATICTGVIFFLRGVSGIWLWTLWRSTPQASLRAHSQAREWSLDAIRGIAIGLVLFAHLHGSAYLPRALTWLCIYLNRGGWIGVDLFFVLSGYLISGLLLEEWRRSGSIQIGRFLYRRAWKIYPAHWFLIIATVVASTFFPVPGCLVTMDGVLYEFLYLQNYLGGIWPHTWSLSVEEQFYALLAFLFAVVLLRNPSGCAEVPSWIPKLALGVFIFCLGLRALRAAYGAEIVGNYMLTHLRLDALMSGVLLRYYRLKDPERFSRWAAKLRWPGIPVSIILLLPAFAFGRNAWMMAVGLTIIWMGACVLLLCLHGWQQVHNAGPATKAMCWLGRYSYTIYLWHFPVAVFVNPQISSSASLGPSLVGVAAYFVLSIGIGVITSLAIERPLLRARDRLFPSSDAEAPSTTRGADYHLTMEPSRG